MAASASASSAGSSAIVRKDPPFFRLVMKTGRQVYILGSPHFVPLATLFDPTVIAEIDRIRGEGAILYTEHEMTNRVALGFLEAGGEEAHLPRGVDLFGIFGTPMDERRSIRAGLGALRAISQWDGAGTDPIRSETNLEELLRAHVWLAAVIAATHANILSYNTYGGTEVDLQRQAGWVAQRYLETVQQAFNLLRRNAHEDYNYNKHWAEVSINKLLRLERGGDLRREMKKTAEDFSWEVIKASWSPPKSALKRNALWVAVIARELEGEEAHGGDEEGEEDGVEGDDDSGGAAAASAASPPVLESAAAATSSPPSSSIPSDPTSAPLTSGRGVGAAPPILGGAPSVPAEAASSSAMEPSASPVSPPLFIVVGNGHLVGRDGSFIGLLLQEDVIDLEKALERFNPSARQWIEADY